ncbi:MAG: hypothetical protein IKS49_01610 [Actinomycetaceae bacterium]|nr:hypothetical protein [Actinomycetaceae bacterium]
MSKKMVALTAVLVFLLAGASVFGFLMWKHKNEMVASPVSFVVNAEGWSEESSSPVPVRVTGETIDKEKVDEKYFIGHSEKDLVLPPGTYKVETYASPVNADGGMYKTSEPVELVVPEIQEESGAPATSASPSVSADSGVAAVASAEINLSPVSPRELADEDIEAAYDAMRDAGLSDKEIGQFEKAVEEAKIPAAAKLSDEELLALLASAPLAPPDVEEDMNVNGVTHYSNNQARVHDIDAYTNDGSSVDTGCGDYGDEREALKPLIVDVNNDGIRDIVSMVRSNPCGVGGTTYFNFLRRIVVYTPTEDGKELRVLAYSTTNAFSEEYNALVSEQFEYSRWWFKEDNVPDGKFWGTTITPMTEPILGFEDGRLSSKMIRTVINDSSAFDSESAENYTVFFEIRGEELVPVEARKG